MLENSVGTHNEISNFVEDRYVTALEAARRTLRFDYVDSQSIFDRFDVLRGGHHTVHCRERYEQPVTGWERPENKIAEYFESHKLQASTRRRFYSEYSMYFTCNRRGKKWKPRAALEIGRRVNDATLAANRISRKQEKQLWQ